MSAAHFPHLLAESKKAARAGDYEKAEAGYRQILGQAPGQRDASLGLAELAMLAQEPAAAVDILSQALSRQPRDSGLLSYKAWCLHASGRGKEALRTLDGAIKLQPKAAEHHVNRGRILAALRKPQEAAGAFLRAIELNPQEIEARWQLALLLHSEGRRMEAADVLAGLLKLAPEHRNALGLRIDLLRQTGQLRTGLSAAADGLRHHPADAALHSQSLLLRQYDDSETPESLLTAARAWGAAVQRPALPRSPAEPLNGRRLRLGYHAADWGERAIHVFTRNLLTAHDRSRVELFVYQDGPRADAFTSRLRAHADHWRETWRADEAGAARMIAEDRLDALIDVNGHMSNPRPGLLARKPARWMIHYLDFPGTTGIPGMDARIADEVAEPAAEGGRWSTETILRLPEGFIVYRGPTQSAEPNDAPVARNGHITFGSVNTLLKLTPSTLRLWHGVLDAVPGSRLLIAREELAEPACLAIWRASLESQGIDLQRVSFVSGGVNFRLLEPYHRIDISLDTTPYNGVTTTGDSLWMGVPVVALLGDRCGARLSASMLHSLGKPEWVARDAEDFIQIAARLAADPARLAEERQTLRGQMLASRLGDSRRLAAAIEDLVVAHSATAERSPASSA